MSYPMRALAGPISASQGSSRALPGSLKPGFRSLGLGPVSWRVGSLSRGQDLRGQNQITVTITWVLKQAKMENLVRRLPSEDNICVSKKIKIEKMYK